MIRREFDPTMSVHAICRQTRCVNAENKSRRITGHRGEPINQQAFSQARTVDHQERAADSGMAAAQDRVGSEAEKGLPLRRRGTAQNTVEIPRPSEHRDQ